MVRPGGRQASADLAVSLCLRARSLLSHRSAETLGPPSSVHDTYIMAASLVTRRSFDTGHRHVGWPASEPAGVRPLEQERRSSHIGWPWSSRVFALLRPIRMVNALVGSSDICVNVK